MAAAGAPGGGGAPVPWYRRAGNGIAGGWHWLGAHPRAQAALATTAVLGTLWYCTPVGNIGRQAPARPTTIPPAAATYTPRPSAPAAGTPTSSPVPLQCATVLQDYYLDRYADVAASGGVVYGFETAGGKRFTFPGPKGEAERAAFRIIPGDEVCFRDGDLGSLTIRKHSDKFEIPYDRTLTVQTYTMDVPRDLVTYQPKPGTAFFVVFYDRVHDTAMPGLHTGESYLIAVEGMSQTDLERIRVNLMRTGHEPENRTPVTFRIRHPSDAEQRDYLARNGDMPVRVRRSDAGTVMTIDRRYLDYVISTRNTLSGFETAGPTTLTPGGLTPASGPGRTYSSLMAELFPPPATPAASVLPSSATAAASVVVTPSAMSTPGPGGAPTPLGPSDAAATVLPPPPAAPTVEVPPGAKY